MEARTGSFSGVVMMALAWAFVWALPGGVIEAVGNVAPAARSLTREVDMWPQTLGIPGLLAGALFSILLLLGEGRRRLEEVAPSRAGAWGSVSGAAVGALVVWVVAPGLSSPGSLAAVLVAYAAFMGAVAGVASTLLFRALAQRRASATG